MTNPKTSEELTTQIEHLVRGYLTTVRQASEEAVGRAFSATSDAASTRATRKSRKPAGRRRPPEEMTRLQEQLEAAVRTDPGTSMTALAAKLQQPLRSLHRPMVLLKRAGRVRTVGERNSTRYFPATQPVRATG